MTAPKQWNCTDAHFSMRVNGVETIISLDPQTLILEERVQDGAQFLPYGLYRYFTRVTISGNRMVQPAEPIADMSDPLIFGKSAR